MLDHGPETTDEGGPAHPEKCVNQGWKTGSTDFLNNSAVELPVYITSILAHTNLFAMRRAHMCNNILHMQRCMKMHGSYIYFSFRSKDTAAAE